MAVKSGYGPELLGVGFFGVAFGFLEAAVVVYLRALFYADGFAFPLRPLPPLLLATEMGREGATLVMLAAVAWAPGGPGRLKLARFLFAFGLWDLFYYVGLKVVIGWPESLFTWDVLFLLPVPWVAPVLAPALVAAYFVAVGAYGIGKRGLIRVPPGPVILAAAGAAALLVTFFWNGAALARGEAPTYYPWPLYGAAFAALAAASVATVAANRGRAGDA
ncbi:MAG: hypothetical protein JSU81_08415 [Candidatus Coatesbacteria bacterium]|nr:MAG: hypothetical protein JSU81_08415 [Candidatus Coatesbacteria bacterium]